MGVEGGGPSFQERSRVDRVRRGLQILGFGVFGGLTAIAIVTGNPGLAAAATTGLVADITLDKGIINPGAQWLKGLRKGKGSAPAAA